MKALPIIIALAVLGAIPLEVHAQTSAPAPTTTDDVGKTGTGTGTLVDSSDDVGKTGTGTGTTEGATVDPATTESVGNTGSGTGTTPTTMTMVRTAAPMPITLSATNTTLPSNGSQAITVSTQANPDALDVSSGVETVPLSSSNAACKVPASVDLPWTSKEGGVTTFQVSCGKINGKSQNVTITGGLASTSFTLKP